MLEKPAIADAKIISTLRDAYGLEVAHLAFLPLGADPQAAAYRVEAAGGTTCFLKIKRGPLNPLAVALPRFLYDQGLHAVIPPLPARSGRLLVPCDPYQAVLYPFVEGGSGYARPLTTAQWTAFGAALRRLHQQALPADLQQGIRREDFSPRWRRRLKKILDTLDGQKPRDHLAAEAASFLQARRAPILDLVDRADRFGRELQAHPPAFVLCHGDIHAGNLLLTDQGELFLVDWDDPIYAPRERDLMFIGGAQGFIGCSPAEEIDRFYRGYGAAPVEPGTLAYYRMERIIVDLVLYAEDLLNGGGAGANRKQAFHYLAANFQPGGTIDMAKPAGQDPGVA